MPFIRYVLENPVYVGDVILQRYVTENHRTHKAVKNTGQLPRYVVTDNHEPIISRETFDKVQAKIKESYDFNPAAHRVVKPSCFSAKIICSKCGQNFVKGMTKSNRHDGLQEHWFCYGKLRKKICDAKNINGYRLRQACCEVLNLEKFDDNIFAHSIKKILTTDTDILEFYFYDGTIKTAHIQYFSQADKNHTDPHQKPFGYTWSREGYVIVPHEAEAVKLMYQYYADGWTISAISRELESKGYKTFRGKLSHRVITSSLDSDFYIGNRTIKGKFTTSGEDEFIENDHEAIVSKELFDIVQKRRVIEKKKQEKRLATRRRMDDEKRNCNSGKRQ